MTEARPRRLAVSAVGALGLAVLALLAWRHASSDDAARSPASGAPHAAVATMQEPVRVRPPTPALPAIDEPPLGVQLDRLLATHDPQDAWRAYWLVADCAAFNANGDRLVFDRDEIERRQPDSIPGLRGMTDAEKRHAARLCAGMTERERQNRLDYLAIAARAGVTGAATAFIDEGPFGDRSALQTRPDDPLVKEWRAAANAQLVRAAEAGADPTALDMAAYAHRSGSDVVGKDPVLAYRYMLAIGLVDADLMGADNAFTRLYAPDSDYMNTAGAELTPDQRAAELAAAQAIAERAREARKRARANAG